MLFVELVRKELRQNQVRVMVLGIAFLGWQMFLYQRLSVWPHDLVGPLAILTILFIPTLAIILSIPALTGEWKHKTIYLLGSLPVSMVTLGLAKLVSIFLEVVLYASISLFNLLYFFNHYRHMIIPPPLPGYSTEALFTNQVFFFVLAYLVAVVTLGALTQWSVLLGKAAWRLGWLLSVGLFAAGGWLVMRGTALLAPLFAWFPQLIMVGQGSSGGIPHYYITYINGGPMVIVLLLSLSLLVVGNVICEQYLEL